MAAQSWRNAVRSALIVSVIMLLTTIVAAQVGIAIEGGSAHGAMLFNKMAMILIAATLLIAPLLVIIIKLTLLERIHRIRVKLFVAAGVGQIVALVIAVAAARSKLMPIEPPTDGLFAMLLIYAEVLSLSLFSLLAASMTAALGTIRAAAARLTDGDLETRVSVETRDELADLAEDLNEMAARLAGAARKERSMEQSRRELIAAVSHDLRTPLAAIRVTIEAILDGVVTDEETVTRYLRTMHSGTRELNRLIDDLFELSRIDAGALSLVAAPTALGDLIGETLDRLGPRAAARGITLSGQADAGLPRVSLDARQISRVLVNLVDNALRHTPDGGSVTVSTTPCGHEVAITIADTGEGIAPDDLPHVFERFYRGEKSRSREHGGAGLGLAISKGIVEAHGGSISAANNAPHGACLTFTLPFVPTRPDERRDQTALHAGSTRF